MKTFLPALILISFSATAQTRDWIKVSSVYSFQETVERLQKEIQQKGFKLFATINHSQEAAAAGLSLPPTVVLILGNPKAGTLLMNCDVQISIDLPLKILVWEDSTGQTLAGFINPEGLLKEYKIDGCKDVLPKMKASLQGILTSVTRKN